MGWDGPTMFPLSEESRKKLEKLLAESASQSQLARDLGMSLMSLQAAMQGKRMQMAKRRRLEKALEAK